MSVTDQTVVDVARQWIGTPYVHQGMCKGGGADCLGLVLGVWKEIGGHPPRDIPRYTPSWAESGASEALMSAARQVLQPATDQIEPGQILLFRLRDASVAKHLGILSECGRAPRFVHAYSGHGVVESPLSDPWSRRIVARFQFPPTGDF